MHLKPRRILPTAYYRTTSIKNDLDTPVAYERYVRLQINIVRIILYMFLKYNIYYVINNFVILSNDTIILTYFYYRYYNAKRYFFNFKKQYSRRKVSIKVQSTLPYKNIHSNFLLRNLEEIQKNDTALTKQMNFLGKALLSFINRLRKRKANKKKYYSKKALRINFVKRKLLQKNRKYTKLKRIKKQKNTIRYIKNNSRKFFTKKKKNLLLKFSRKKKYYRLKWRKVSKNYLRVLIKKYKNLRKRKVRKNAHKRWLPSLSKVVQILFKSQCVNVKKPLITLLSAKRRLFRSHKKMLKKLKYFYSKEPWVKDYLTLMHIGFEYSNLSYFLIYIYWCMWGGIAKPKHSHFFKFLIGTLKIFYFIKQYLIGLKLIAAGTFNRHSRTKTFFWETGRQVAANWHINKIIYDTIDFPFEFGVFSVHLWVVFQRTPQTNELNTLILKRL